MQFSNLSQFNPECYTRHFDGGIPETSKEKNPLIKYDTMGAFNVKLVAANTYGEEQGNRV